LNFRNLLIGNLDTQIGNITEYMQSTQFAEQVQGNNVPGIITAIFGYLNNITVSDNLPPQTPDIILSDLARELELGTINIYVLGYNNKKQLIGNANSNALGTTDNLPLTLTTNIKRYLENFKLMTDVVAIHDGYIVNFGVIFDVIAEKYANKQDVKLNCIQKIKDYFRIEKMQFNQPIFKSNLEFELMGVEGVRSIGHITLTQKDDYNSDVADADLENATYTYSFSSSGEGADIDGDGTTDGGFVDQSEGEGTAGYGYKYNFQTALSTDGTIVLPPNTSTPTVFELKNPNQNIQGRVR